MSEELPNVQVVLLAGGEGSRLWPLSRKGLPKQFLPFAPHGKTLIQAAFERARQIGESVESIWVCANRHHVPLLNQQLPDLRPDQLLLEPIGRNTAASLGWAALCIRAKDPDAVIVSLPSDHLFRDLEPWLEAVRSGIKAAWRFERLVLLGINPIDPSPQYGYLKIAHSIPFENTTIYEIERFIEKPSLAEAKSLIAQGKVLWNTGGLIAKVNVLLKAFERQLPEAYSLLRQIWANPALLRKRFGELPSISIDVGILEKETSLLAVQGEFERLDIGNLISLGKLLPTDDAGNRTNAVIVDREAHQNLAITDQGMIGLFGVDGLAVVRWGDVVLVCPQDRLEEIKAFQAQIVAEGWEKYL